MSDNPLLTEEEMLREEKKFLWPAEGSEPAFKAGLALSGGGVRAATVALGVLQVLADRGLLSRFHYLSTVSGGGYIGSALSWFWSSKRVEGEITLLRQPDKDAPVRFGADRDDFPFQEKSKTPPPLGDRAADNLKFLRNHGSYLTSGDGIGFAGLIVAVLRTILLSLTVWLPILIGLFVGLEVFDQMLSGGGACEKPATNLAILQCRPLFASLLILGGIFLFIFVAGVILFSFLGPLQIDSVVPRRRYLRVAAWSVASAVCLYFAVQPFSQLNNIQPMMGVQIVVLTLGSPACLMLATAEFFSPANPGYFLRRSFEKYSSFALPFVVAFVFIGALPLIAAYLPFIGAPPPSAANSKAGLGELLSLPGAFGSLGAAITLVSGVGTALYGYYLTAKSILPGVAGQIFATAGSLLFLSGLLLCSFVLAAAILSFTEITFAEDDPGFVVKRLITPAFLSLVALAVAIGVFGSVNATGLHRFYRDRLMETFMPMTSAIKEGAARQSDVADNLSVADVVRSAAERGNRPYHLVNAHAILVNEKNNPKIVLRGGDNFLISPAFVGSSATKWMRTKHYIERHGMLTLASAMAASGAAANANAGYTGTGLTRDRFVSTVMSLLNIRLGLWVSNPGAVWTSPCGRPKTATYFRPVFWSGIFGLGRHSKAAFLELSDGGHFENLGLYELMRRKLDLIVVVDAEQDNAVSLAALVSSTNRVKEDFGATIEFLDAKGPEMLLGQKSDRYPNGVLLAKSPFVVAKIHYKDGTSGVLIYIKSTMVKGLEFATEGYRAANPDFPHQSTADQFFDPDQFEAYRDLGKTSCTLMIDGLKLETNFGNLLGLQTQYGWPAPPQATSPA